MIKKIIDFLFPMCPQGGHRIRDGLVRDTKGNYYCWHRDCVVSHFKDVSQEG